MIATGLAGNYSAGWALLTGAIGAMAMLPILYGGRLRADPRRPAPCLDPSSTGAATGLGILIGVVHGMLIAVMMPTMLTMGHPMVKDGTISAPGPAMTGFGRMPPHGNGSSPISSKDW